MSLWIRVDAATPDDPKISDIADALEIEPTHALGLIVSVWCKMASHAVSGSLANISNNQIERWAGWRGSRGVFAIAFLAAFTDDKRMLNGWLKRQGNLIARMERDRQRHRTSPYAEQKAESNAEESGTKAEQDSVSPQHFHGISTEDSSPLSVNAEESGTKAEEIVETRNESGSSEAVSVEIPAPRNVTEVQVLKDMSHLGCDEREADPTVLPSQPAVPETHFDQPDMTNRDDDTRTAESTAGYATAESAGGEPDRYSRTAYPPAFEALWDAYPKRHGTNSKRGAYDQWLARIKKAGKGEAAVQREIADMFAGVEAYAAHQREKYGDTPSEYTMAAERFLGKKEHYRDEWPLLAARTNGNGSTNGHTNGNGKVTPEQMRALIRQHDLMRWSGNGEEYFARVDAACPHSMKPQDWRSLVMRVEPTTLTRFTFEPDLVKEIARKMASHD
jgi:hypothetical protein